MTKATARDGAPYHHGDLANALIDAATRVIESAGPDAVTLRGIAADAGVFHRAAYRHFANKEALLAAVYARAYERLAAALAGVAVGGPQAKLRAIALAYADFAFDNPNLFLAITGPRINLDGAHPDLEKAIARAFKPLAAAIKEGRETGAFGQSASGAQAALFFGALQGVVSQIVHRRIKVSPANRRAFMVEIADRLIAAIAVGA